MANIDNLTTTEKKDLCNLIGGNNFMRFFKDNPNEYQKIKPGFRVKSLKSEEALALGLRYVEKPVVNRFIEWFTSCGLEEIKQRQEDFLKKEDNKGLADFMVLKDSLFRQNIPLYFKLSKRDESEGYVQLLSYLVENAVKEDKEKEVADSSCGLLTKQVNELKKKLEESENLYTAEKQNHEKLLAADKDLQNKLEEKLQNAEKAKLEILNDLKKEKLNLENQLSNEKNRKNMLNDVIESLKHDNKNLQDKLNYIDETFLPGKDFAYKSICVVEEDNSSNIGILHLRRIADVKDGIVQAGFDPDIESRRTNLFGNNLPSVGNLGVWNWKIEESFSGREYIRSQLDTGLHLIQVVFCNATSREEMVHEIREGIEADFVSDKLLIVYLKDNDVYEGVCCNKSNIKEVGNKLYLKEEVYKLPLFEFAGQPFFTYKSYTYYRKFYLGQPVAQVEMQESAHIIKELLSRKISWRAMKGKGLGRHKFQHLKKFLSDLTAIDFYTEVSKACDCSLEDAQNMVDVFVKKADCYISGKDITNDIIADVIDNSDDLKMRMNEMSYQRWLEENKESITVKNHELVEIEKKLAAKQLEVEELQKNEKNLVDEIDSLEKELSTKQSVSTQLDIEVRKNIQNAEKNVSSFLVDLMMKYGLHTETKALDAKPETKSLFNPGPKLEKEPDTFIDKKDFLGNLSENLESAGIAGEYASKLSYYLYAAYLQRFPIMLAGPNGEAVADAFSCMVNNQLAGKVDFHGDFDSNTFSLIRHSSDKVIAVTNPFNSRWISYLPKLLENDKFYIFTTPYPEEMQLEPASLYNLVFPLSIDEMIEAVPQYDGFMGGSWDKKEGFGEIKPNTSYKRVLELCQIRPLMEKNVSRVIQAWCNLSGEQMISNDDMWRFIIYPYAYATRHMSEAAHYLSDSNIQVSDSISKLFEKANEE